MIAGLPWLPKLTINQHNISEADELDDSILPSAKLLNSTKNTLFFSQTEILRKHRYAPMSFDFKVYFGKQKLFANTTA